MINVTIGHTQLIEAVWLSSGHLHIHGHIMLRLCIVDPIISVWFVATLTVPYAEYGEPPCK